MNQEIDFQAIWNSLTTSVDWLLYGIVFLVGLNVVFGIYFGWTVLTQPDFFTRYSLSRSSNLVQQAQQLEPVPSMEEIDVNPPEKQGELPTRYVELRSTNLFTPMGRRSSAIAKKTTGGTKPAQKKKELPKIEGYQIVGRIAGQASKRVSMLKRVDDGKTFIAREGEFLDNTDIKVAKISDTVVLLKQPSHKPTRFQFTTDEIEERLRQGIMLH